VNLLNSCVKWILAALVLTTTVGLAGTIQAEKVASKCPYELLFNPSDKAKYAVIMGSRFVDLGVEPARENRHGIWAIQQGPEGPQDYIVGFSGAALANHGDLSRYMTEQSKMFGHKVGELVGAGEFIGRGGSAFFANPTSGYAFNQGVKSRSETLKTALRDTTLGTSDMITDPYKKTDPHLSRLLTSRHSAGNAMQVLGLITDVKLSRTAELLSAESARKVRNETLELMELFEIHPGSTRHTRFQPFLHLIDRITEGGSELTPSELESFIALSNMADPTESLRDLVRAARSQQEFGMDHPAESAIILKNFLDGMEHDGALDSIHMVPEDLGYPQGHRSVSAEVKTMKEKVDQLRDYLDLMISGVKVESKEDLSKLADLLNSINEYSRKLVPERFMTVYRIRQPD